MQARHHTQAAVHQAQPIGTLCWWETRPHNAMFVTTLAIIWFTQLTFTQGWPDTFWAKVPNNAQSYVLCHQSCWAVKTLNSYQLNCSAKPGRLRLDTSESVAMAPRTKQCLLTSGKGLDSKLLEMRAAFFKPSRHLVFLTGTSSNLHYKKRCLTFFCDPWARFCMITLWEFSLTLLAMWFRIFKLKRCMAISLPFNLRLFRL